ncbi:uncharacterized protein BDCG_03099 [Blastomyces dermatitidis ER-3]|uniref:Uncharacterized protein n=1 Tax=Ajellomyces dermatitidis (strain ER-3 / ATCC MYA-2586) TaxID=559297 RepID=A0ABP2EXW3_AJEDR|nr:uncharacterized protein BDCG_03099 [Blastomyces dermatitidis ER-3]EEQ87979.2 hypothetical protein BDCG_03099 [Blastomyces dermatitidis ER-3]
MTSYFPTARVLQKHFRKRRARSPPSSTADTKDTTKTTSTTAYNCNFQQNLIDHGVYPDGPSLSSSKFSDGHFRKFKRADTHASKEQPVTTSVIPIIEGNVSDLKCTAGGYLFGNLAPLTDGTLAQAKPDHFYDARPEQLDCQICKELSNHIISSTQCYLLMLANFFLEAKGPDGSLAVATWQASYDNNTYTLASTYHGGTLKLYTTHLTEPEGPNHCPEYFTTQFKGWSMTSDPQTFREGACAYRNARDWAKEKRDGFIKLANEQRLDAQSQQHWVSQQGTASDEAVTLDDSDVSTVSDEVAYQNVQWSFATPVEDADEISSILSRMPKKPRLNASVPFDGTADKITSYPN